MTYQKIIEYCKENNLSLSAFEKMCGIGNGVIDDWKETSMPSLASLTKIAEATGIPVSEWVG